MRSDRVERYILRQVVMSTFAVLGIITAVVMLVDYIEMMRTLDAAPSATPIDVLWLTAMKTPNILVVVTPFVLMFGTLNAYVRLNKKSELIVMRASGVSAWRFIRPAALFAALFGCLATLAFSPIASILDSRFEQERDELLARHDPERHARDIWLRQSLGSQQLVIRGKRQEQIGRTLLDASIFVFEKDPSGVLRFVRRLEASTAVLNTGFWQLTNIEEIAPGLPKSTLDAVALPTPLRDSDLHQQLDKPGAVTFWSLPKTITQMKAAGFSTNVYTLKWHQGLAAPFLYMGMTILAAAFALRLNRLGGLVGLAGIGASAGFAVYFLNDIFGAFANANLIAPYLSAWIPPAVAILTGITILSYTEDG